MALGIKASYASMPETEDPHVAVTMYDFIWPAEGNTSVASDDANGIFCKLSLNDRIDLPANLKN